MHRLLHALRSIILTTFFLLSFSGAYAQISIDQSDMPVINDTFRITTAAVITGIDPLLTGANYTWDFTSLTSLTQQVDTFLSVSSSPSLYQLIFNSPLDPNRANLATRRSLLAVVPGIEVGDVYEFYRSSAGSFGFLGFAGSFSGIPVPVKYDDQDVWYSFPMAYGNVDSSDVSFSFSLPGIAFIHSIRARKNTVDGWGEVSTPYGNFQALRLRSEVTEYDSVYLDSLGQGIGINRVFTEYKWLAKGMGVPVLQITQEGLLTTVTYLDSNRSNSSGLIQIEQPSLGKLNVFPNPADNSLHIRFSSADSEKASVLIFDAAGRQVYLKEGYSVIKGENSWDLSKVLNSLDQGSYTIRVQGKRNAWQQQLIRN